MSHAFHFREYRIKKHNKENAAFHNVAFFINNNLFNAYRLRFTTKTIIYEKHKNIKTFFISLQRYEKFVN